MEHASATAVSVLFEARMIRDTRKLLNDLNRSLGGSSEGLSNRIGRALKNGADQVAQTQRSKADAVELMSRREIDKMRRAGEMAYELLDFLAPMVQPGVTTLELNDEAERWTKARGARSAPLGYYGFPKSICTSVNEVVCHGIPNAKQVLKDGDIINIDVTPIVDGFHGDTSRTFLVGSPSEKARKLVEVTEKCMYLGIEAVKPGGTVGDIGYAIQTYAEGLGYSVVRDFVGHGVGKTFHTGPQVPHYGLPGDGERLRTGMVFTIEPMINEGTHEVKVLADKWTAVTKDRKLSAQFEHTIAVTNDGYEILTMPRS